MVTSIKKDLWAKESASLTLEITFFTKKQIVPYFVPYQHKTKLQSI